MEEIRILQGVLHAAREIGGSLALGRSNRLANSLFTVKRGEQTRVYIVSLGMSAFLTAISTTFGFSPLLAGMTAGAVLANMGGGAFKL